MHAISTIPFLCAALALFWLWLGIRSVSRGWINLGGLLSLALWIAGLGAWGLASAHWATSGLYDSEAFLQLLPGFWVPLVPTFITMALLAVPSFRSVLTAVVAHHPRSLVLVQALRIAAIGGVFKGLNGLLPAFFALPVGIPDFLFGLTALALVVLWPREGWTARPLIIWNLLGMAVIMPAPLLMQMGLPGPMYVFTTTPDARALLDYPMVMAPTLIVPLFITMNAIHAAVLWFGAASIRRSGATTGTLSLLPEMR